MAPQTNVVGLALRPVQLRLAFASVTEDCETELKPTAYPQEVHWNCSKILSPQRSLLIRTGPCRIAPLLAMCARTWRTCQLRLGTRFT